MESLLWRLFDDLNRLKEYNAGYSSKSKDCILIETRGKIYRLKLEEIKETELDMTVIDKYLKQ